MIRLLCERRTLILPNKQAIKARSFVTEYTVILESLYDTVYPSDDFLRLKNADGAASVWMKTIQILGYGGAC